MIKRKNETFTRAKKMLLNDNDIPTETLGILRSDMLNILSGYFEFNTNSLNIDVILTNAGSYCLKIDCNIDRIKAVKIL
ncbi:MAG: hypothetical protein R3Y23_02270 [Bacillota bacterium]